MNVLARVYADTWHMGEPPEVKPGMYVMLRSGECYFVGEVSPEGAPCNCCCRWNGDPIVAWKQLVEIVTSTEGT